MEERQVAGAAGSSQNKAGEVTICIDHPGKYCLPLVVNNKNFCVHKMDIELGDILTGEYFLLI